VRRDAAAGEVTTTVTGYTLRELTTADLAEARSVMLRSVIEDFKSEYDPRIHADIDDLIGWYTTPAGPFMLVAQDDTTGRIIGTGGVRGGALKEGLSPPHLVEKYGDGWTGQIVRVYVLREERRRGIARAIVRAAMERAESEHHYDRIVFHTFLHSPGAVAFWTSMGAELVEDDTEGVSNAMFYEFPASAPAGAPTGGPMG
jgi:GNAT superfamily N-acetyltransferase